MSDLFNCKHGLIKQTCVLCKDLSDEVVKKEYGSRGNFFDADRLNSKLAGGVTEDQDNAYDIEIDFDTDDGE